MKHDLALTGGIANFGALARFAELNGYRAELA